LDIGDVYVPWFLSHATLYRLFAPDFLPANLKRVIYLDCDIVVRESLLGLWQTDLNGVLVGCVQNVTEPWFACVPQLPWKERGLPPDAPYFNAGVLVIDTDAWRRERVGERVLEVLSTFEATNALDSESERIIQESLASLRGSCAVLMVAHRIKTVELADRIIVLSQGKVVETGTWTQLLADYGLFRRYAEAQGIEAESAATP